MTDDRLNWSTLRYMATSPRLLAWRRDHPRPDTPALRLGRAIHCAALEPDEFVMRWVVAGQCEAATKGGGGCRSGGSLYLDGHWYCRVRGHAPEGAGDVPEGIEVIGADEHALTLQCAESVHSFAPAAELLETGEAERRIEWTDDESGIACRGRVDWLDRGRGLLADLKSTRRETMRDLVGDAARNGYHGQLAWYHDGLIAAGLIPADAPRPAIIAVQTVEPYDVVVGRLSQVSLAAGRIWYRDLLRRYSECVAAGWWPGIAPEVVEIDLPTWAGGMLGPETEAQEEW